jgi:hypothetical protein
MTDRELLELAADAAGLQYDPTVRYAVGLFVVPEGASCQGDLKRWNPLADDGDALRLAVKLELTIWFGANYVIVGGVQEPTVNNAGDPYAAVRHAIVRAAAEIGKAMK